MKNRFLKNILLIFLILIIALSATLSACNSKKFTIEGYVLDYFNSGIKNFTVEINGTNFTTNNEGYYIAELNITDSYTVKINSNDISYEKILKKEDFTSDACTLSIFLEVKNTYTVTGFALDEYDNFKPLSGVKVAIDGTNYSATTGNDGRYTISFIPNNYDKTVFTFTKDGYIKTTQALSNTIFSDTATLDVKLSLQTMFYGNVTNVQGEKLNNVRVTIRPIIDNSKAANSEKNYTIVKEVKTDENGNYKIGEFDFICVSNEYIIKFEKENYVSKSINLTVNEGRLFLENVVLEDK